MKKLLFIIYLLFLSCDSSEVFGVHEIDDTTLDYYDYIARGWQAVFEGDFDLAFSDFTEATGLDSVEYKNSAYVGLGWTSTFYANSFFNSSECLGSIDIACEDIVDGHRLDAENYFNLAGENLVLAKAEYVGDNVNCDVICEHTDVGCNDCNSGTYINTFENFDLDRQVGQIYLDLLEFDMKEFDVIGDANDLAELNDIIAQLDQFLIDNLDYDIVLNKPDYASTYDLNYIDLHALLSQLLLRTGNICDAHSHIVMILDSIDNYCDLNACSNPDLLTEQECIADNNSWDVDSCTDNSLTTEQECIADNNYWDQTCNGNPQIILQCLQIILE